MIEKTDKIFLEITSRDVLAYLEKKHEKDIENFAIIRKQLVKTNSKIDLTNGKVKRAMWIATTALTLSIMAIGFVFQSL